MGPQTQTFAKVRKKRGKTLSQPNSALDKIFFQPRKECSRALAGKSAPSRPEIGSGQIFLARAIVRYRSECS